VSVDVCRRMPTVINPNNVETIGADIC
jgi:hypothetical protein